MTVTFFSKFRLALSPTLYKFIVWACWAWVQSCFGVQAKTGPYNYLFNLLRLLFVSFGLVFQDFLSLTHTKNSLHFHSPFSLLLIYIHMSIAFHTISSQIHLDKKRCHLLSIFQWHLHNSNFVVSFDHNPCE